MSCLVSVVVTSVVELDTKTCALVMDAIRVATVIMLVLVVAIVVAARE